MKRIVVCFLLLRIIIEGSIHIEAHEVRQGEIYLTNATQSHRLTGQWRFSRQDDLKFANPELDDTSWEWIQVPGIWNMLGIEDVKVVWYRCRFELSPHFRRIPIAVRVPTIADSHELYINGQLIGGAGKISSTGEILKKSLQPGVYRIPDKILNRNKPNVIAVRIGDDVGWGGFETPDLLIGRAELIELNFNKFVLWNSSIFIILAFLGLYFLFLYFGFDKDRSYLYFSLHSLSISSILFAYNAFTFWVFDNYWVYHFLMNMPVQITMVFGFHFFYAFYGYRDDLFLKIVTLFGCCFALILIATPFHLSILRFYGNVSLVVALILDAIGYLIMFFLVVKGIVRKKKGAMIVGLGCIINIVCFLNDILGYLAIIENRRLGSEGTLIFMICVSFAMFFKNSRIRIGTSYSNLSVS